MKKHVVIVGAGFAGLELATRLSESLRDAVHVTLIDRNDSFYFGFSKLDVLLGRQAPTDVLLHYRDIAKEGVEFRQETVTAIDPLKRRVITGRGLLRRRLPRGGAGRGVRPGGDAGIPAGRV